jgi:hypothetical protein
VSSFQLLDEELDVGGDYFLGGLGLGVEGREVTLVVSFVVAFLLIG